MTPADIAAIAAAVEQALLAAAGLPAQAEVIERTDDRIVVSVERKAEEAE